MIYLALLLVLSIITIVIAEKSAMLRTEIFNIANFQKLTITRGIKKPRPAFSLGRTQLAFWTVIVSSSFIYSVINQLITMHKLSVPPEGSG